ncbi:MAG: acyl-CoA dehydrogenase family protein [Deltaproteobacteria bacterium]|nr:acyl-CoA dehydrogenase family protein [Deltaproteobacteria bacterium]
MGNFLNDNDDLAYYLDKGVDWPALVEVTEYGFKDPEGPEDFAEAAELYRDILSGIGEFVAEEIAPKAATIDRQGVRLEGGEVVTSKEFEQIFKQVRELDLHGMCLPRSLGGLNCPMLLYFVTVELMARADVSVMSHFGFHGGIAAAMLLFSLKEGTTELPDEPWKLEETRFRDYIDEIVAGKAWGCMDITEPDAGSDMAALRTVGEQDEDGNWFVTGQKIFITSGHGKYHFVIARTEKADSSDPMGGLKGLSMFLVNTYEDGPEGRTRFATVERLEEKLGHHGSITAAINFERSPAHLIGKPGEGFKYMLVLMNNARVGVGFESLGMCEAAYRLARDYAAERPSMGKTIDQHEMIADYLDEMDTDIRAIRALAMKAGFHEEMASKLDLYSAASDTEVDRKAIKRHKRIARRITPLLKYLASEKGVEMARRCMQIHGGNGYMKEYGAEKLLRDALVLPIYEGTSQIQSLMAMKDTLQGIMANPQRFVRRLAQTRWRALSARDPLEKRVARLQQVSLSAQQHLITRTAAGKFKSLQGKPIGEWPNRFLKNWDPKRDFSFAMLHAERLTRILADEVVCETLLEQTKRHPERSELLEAYLERAEPRCRYLADEITSTGSRLLSKLGVFMAEGDEQAAG